MDITVHTKYSIGQKLYKLDEKDIITYHISEMRAGQSYTVLNKRFETFISYSVELNGAWPPVREEKISEADIERRYFTSKADILKELAEQLADK